MFNLNDTVAVRVHSEFHPVGRITCVHKPQRGHLPRFTVELARRNGGSFKSKTYINELLPATVCGPLRF